MSQQPRASCQVCEQHSSKYKCPHCSIPYCSPACFQLHRQPNQATSPVTLCSAVVQQLRQPSRVLATETNWQPEDNELIKTDYIEDESLRLSQEQLGRLGKNEALLKMLGDAGLRDKISEIDNSRMRLNLLQKALLDEEFMRFADEALKTVGKGRQP